MAKSSVKLNEFVAQCGAALSDELKQQLDIDTYMVTFKTNGTIDDVVNSLLEHMQKTQFVVETEDKSRYIRHIETGLALRIYKYDESVRISVAQKQNSRGHGSGLKRLLKL